MTHDTSRRWQMLAISAAIVYVFWLLAPVLMPFAFAAMLAYWVIRWLIDCSAFAWGARWPSASYSPGCCC